MCIKTDTQIKITKYVSIRLIKFSPTNRLIIRLLIIRLQA